MAAPAWFHEGTWWHLELDELFADQGVLHARRGQIAYLMRYGRQSFGECRRMLIPDLLEMVQQVNRIVAGENELVSAGEEG